MILKKKTCIPCILARAFSLSFPPRLNSLMKPCNLSNKCEDGVSYSDRCLKRSHRNIIIPSKYLIYCFSVGGVLLSGPERTLSCPGSSVQYSCDVSPAVNSITWSLQCPNMRATTYSVGRQQSNYNSIYNCSTAGVSLSTSIVFHSDGSVAAQSNLSISVLVTSYSVNTFRSLRIDCEDSGNFKYMDAKGKLCSRTKTAT